MKKHHPRRSCYQLYRELNPDFEGILMDEALKLTGYKADYGLVRQIEPHHVYWKSQKLSYYTKEEVERIKTWKSLSYNYRSKYEVEHPEFDGVWAEDVLEETGRSNYPTLRLHPLCKKVKWRGQTLSYFEKDDVEKVKNERHGWSRAEKEVVEYLEGVYGSVTENYRMRDKKELDIYIPEKKVAIEFDGLYWHSEQGGKDKGYHLEKTKTCNENGVRLIHIFDDEWRDKKEICQSIICSAVGVYKEKYYARKCVVKQIPTKVANEFLDLHHINGSVCTASKAWGLLYKGELLQVITVGRNRFKKDGKTMELLRMATKMFTQVVGGFSKLLKDSGIDEIESYIDRRLYNGSGYESSGWKVIGESRPSYFYTDFKVRKNRLAFMKSKLPPVEEIEGGGTEIERAHALGWYRIWDCGTIKVSWKRK